MVIPLLILFFIDSLDDCGLRFLLAMKHYAYLLRCLPLAQRATLQRAGVGTCNLVWAFHSETHPQLLALLPGYTKGQPKWSTMRELGEIEMYTNIYRAGDLTARWRRHLQPHVGVPLGN